MVKISMVGVNYIDDKEVRWSEMREYGEEAKIFHVIAIIKDDNWVFFEREVWETGWFESEPIPERILAFELARKSGLMNGILSFEELEKREFPTARELEATLEYYATRGLDISTLTVMSIINRTKLTREDRERLSGWTNVGIKVLADRNETKKADQYAIVRIALVGSVTFRGRSV